MKVNLETGPIEVLKLPIGKYAEFLTIIRELLTRADNVNKLVNLSDGQFLSELPNLLATNLPEILKLISLGSGLTDEEVAQLGLDECLELLTAIVEVNKYASVYEKIKKGLARLPKGTIPTTPTGSMTQSTH